MKPLPVICLLIFFLLQVKGFDAFSQKPVFTQVPQPENGSIYLITQDSKGYMWFGGNGVHRYDGYSYKSYFWDPMALNSLAANKIEAICADKQGFIWVATTNNGLDRLDPETGIFKHYRHKPENSNSISSDTISTIIVGQDGKIWIGTQPAGLNCLDPTTGKITRYKHDPKDSNSLSYNEVTALYEDKHGDIWVGTGVLWSRPQDRQLNFGGLNRLNRANDNFTRFMHDPNDSSSLIDNMVRSIFEDSKGNFWVGTSGDGLHSMNREKGSFERHRYNAAEPNGLSRPPIRNTMGWVDDMISFIREDVSGSLWIGTMSGGLSRYDPATKLNSYYTSLNNKPTDKNKVSLFYSSYNSRDGVLWIGDYTDGIHRLDPFHIQINKHDAGSIVTSLLKSGNGNFWLGTNFDGLRVYDNNEENKIKLMSGIFEKNQLIGKHVYSIIEDQKGTIWIGTNKGLASYDSKTKKLQAYAFKGNIFSIYEDSLGSLWLGTERGLELMKRTNNSFNSYRQNITDTPILKKNWISNIRADKSGNLWIGSVEWGGLTRFNIKRNEFFHYLPNISIQSIFEDTNDQLWIGTDKGLYYFNSDKNIFEQFSNMDARFADNISIYHILEDGFHFLWLNTSMGLFRLRQDRREIISYTKRDANLPNIYSATQAGCFKSKNGELFFSNNQSNGYYSFYPDQLKSNTIKPVLQISTFRISDQVIQPGKGSPLSEPLSQTKEIRLTHKQNVFSFDFSGIHYSNPEGNRHLYKLENFDNDWRRAGEEKTAYYYNVQPGNYVFRVKASNSDGVWSDEKSIAIFISPPWWKTSWAYSFYGFCILAGLFLADRIQRRRIRAKERMLSREKELAQAHEIEKAYHTLKSTQSQLIQSEKMASLGELTAGIAHEIQNPLNFVNNFSEVNKELLIEMKAEIGKGNLPEAEAIANDVIDNEDKINHHGKRADSIVKGMLQHSQKGSGQKEPTDINAMAEEYLRLAYHGCLAKDITLNVSFQADLDKTIGNVNLVQQDISRVLLNLYNNAFYAVAERQKKESGDYQPMVKLITSNKGNTIEIHVTDNGSGIPENIKEKIFQPFFTTKPTGQGTGLGLSLSYDIIKAQGGELKVESKEGEGSVFVVLLPA